MSWGLFIIPYFTEAALYSYLIQNKYIWKTKQTATGWDNRLRSMFQTDHNLPPSNSYNEYVAYEEC